MLKVSENFQKSTAKEKESMFMCFQISFTDYLVLGFVAGLFLQEALEAYRQGIFNYLSKWWNVVDTLIVLTFLLSYAIWLRNMSG